MPLSETAKRVRKFAFDEMVNTGRVSNIARIIKETGFSKDEVMQSLDEPGLGIFLQPGTATLRVVGLFSNITTPFEVEVEGERKWYAE